MKARVYLSVILLTVVMAITVGCAKAPNDAQIQNDIQSKLGMDSGLQGKQLGVQSANGVVTLSGNVDNDIQRDAAARFASSVPGVKEVVNNVQVTPAAPPPEQTAQTPPPPPVQEEKPKPVSKPRATARRHHSDAMATDTTTTSASSAPMTAAAATPPPAPAPPPPPPPPQKVTIPAGTTLAVRLVDTVDSEKATQAQTFHATLNSPLAVEGDTVIPAGYDVEGHVVNVQSAGKFAGQSLLVLQLDRISAGEKYYNIQTDQYTRKGSSRGKNTAEKVGAGAGIGAIIGALAGGGKGAAIGAAAGGGLGGGVQAATKGQQIKLPSETVLNFTLQAPLTVVPASGPNSGRQRLDSNNQ
jgi:hypothetical protein